MDEKPWYLSKTIIGALIAVIAGVLSVFGIALPDSQFLTDEAVKVAEAVAVVVGSVVAIIGRFKADSRVTLKKAA